MQFKLNCHQRMKDTRIPKLVYNTSQPAEERRLTKSKMETNMEEELTSLEWCMSCCTRCYWKCVFTQRNNVKVLKNFTPCSLQEHFVALSCIPIRFGKHGNSKLLWNVGTLSIKAHHLTVFVSSPFVWQFLGTVKDRLCGALRPRPRDP